MTGSVEINSKCGYNQSVEAIAAVTLQFDAVSAVSGSPLTPDVTGSVEINSKFGYNQSVKLSRQSLFSLMQ